MSKVTALPWCGTVGEVGAFWPGTSGVAAVSLGASHGSIACSDLCGHVNILSVPQAASGSLSAQLSCLQSPQGSDRQRW